MAIKNFKELNIKTILQNFNYQEYWKFLQKKYSIPPKDYYANNKFASKSPFNTRTKDGLYIHHIDEDKAIMLSTTKYAKLHPFKYQKKERLVYCNLIEHLVLHIKIVEKIAKQYNEATIINLGIGGIFNFIIPQLNDIFSGIVYKQQWQENCRKVLLDKKEDYLNCLEYIEEHFFKWVFNYEFIYRERIFHSYGKLWKKWSHKKNEVIYKEIVMRFLKNNKKDTSNFLKELFKLFHIKIKLEDVSFALCLNHAHVFNKKLTSLSQVKKINFELIKEKDTVDKVDCYICFEENISKKIFLFFDDHKKEINEKIQIQNKDKIFDKYIIEICDTYNFLISQLK